MTGLQKRGHPEVRIDRLAQRWRDAGLRLTAQRLAVVQTLRESRSHPTAEQLYQKVRKRVPGISRNTIYLNLEALQRVGETSEVWIAHDASRFEPNPLPHDHAVCVTCKKVVDIYDPALRRLKIPRRLRPRFTVISHRVDFFGQCRACRIRPRHKEPGS